MHTKLEIVDPTNYVGWDERLSSIQDSTFFHTAAWAKVLKESYRYNAVYFTAFDHQKLLAAIPVMEIKSVVTGNRGISLPFSDYCAPIVVETGCFPDIMAAVIAYGKKSGWRFIEWRGGENFHQYAAPSSCYYGHSLALFKNETRIFSGFRSSTKGNIKKAVKEGVVVNRSNTLEAVNEFYRLNCVTRKRNGLPPQPYGFFKKIFDHIISQNLGLVILASFQQKNIAGAIFFHFGKKAMFKYGASDLAYQHLRANNLVIWEAIKWHAQCGFENFCFGRTDPENRGLRQFKNGWGATEQLIHYYKYDLRKNAFVRNHPKVKAWQSKIFHQLPVGLLRAIGAACYKHIG